VTTVILLRHAHSVANEKGVLAGRTSGVALSKKGIEQAENLKKRLGNLLPNSIRVSPIERCLQTIQPWLSEQGISRKQIHMDNGISEVDYGDWTGKKLSFLALKKQWRVVQKTPSKMIFPRGEALIDVQKRAMKSLMKAIEKSPGGVVLLVSHGDVIKSIVAEALELELDKFQKIVIDPSSISVLDFSKGKFRILHLNDSSTCFEYLGKKSRSMKSVVGGGSGRS